MSKGGQSSGMQNAQQVKPDMTDNLLGLLKKAESRSYNLFEGKIIYNVLINLILPIFRRSDAER